MVTVIVASNILVNFPVHHRLAFGHLAIDLADVLTYGALTWPFAFLITDLANRALGPRAARRVVTSGFAVAVILSIWLANPRIALASGSAFLAAQLLDIAVFDRLRHRAWWAAPLCSSALGAIVDSALFFSLAFAAPLVPVLGHDVPFAGQGAPLLGVLPGEAPRWISWMMGDLAVKWLMVPALLLPYRLCVTCAYWPGRAHRA